MSRKTTISVSWEQMGLFAETCELILCTDNEALAALNTFLTDIEKQYPFRKALTKTRQEIRARTTPTTSNKRIRYSKPKR